MIETTDGYRFGAYISLYFGNEVQQNGYRKDDQAFIFSFDTGKKFKLNNQNMLFLIQKEIFQCLEKEIYL